MNDANDLQLWNELAEELKKPYYLEAERIKNQHRQDFPGKFLPETPTSDSSFDYLIVQYCGEIGSRKNEKKATKIHVVSGSIDCATAEVPFVQYLVVARRQSALALQDGERLQLP